jgi:flavin-dependent dehydrogenase
MSRQIGDRAVVLGASMAGLLAARVLADAYGQVTVIDRDQLPHTGTNRRGVPTAATCMPCWHAASKHWRSCSPG